MSPFPNGFKQRPTLAPPLDESPSLGIPLSFFFLSLFIWMGEIEGWAFIFLPLGCLPLLLSSVASSLYSPFQSKHFLAVCLFVRGIQIPFQNGTHSRKNAKHLRMKCFRSIKTSKQSACTFVLQSAAVGVGNSNIQLCAYFSNSGERNNYDLWGRWWCHLANWQLPDWQKINQHRLHTFKTTQSD